MTYKSDLDRFTEAQRRDYPAALSEIKNGRKRSHWMWYIFPQIKGLGFSPAAQYYAIKNLEEAKAFLADPYLGGNLCEICHALLQLNTTDAYAVFGHPDDMKLRSSMTLFSLAAEENSVFHRVLHTFFEGEPDRNTLKILQNQLQNSTEDPHEKTF